MNFVPAIEGLRGVAILIVMLAHLGFGNQVPARFGVTLFFFISGYLITGILLRENPVAIGNFYARRFLRLAPALFVMVVSIAIIYMALGIRPNGLEITAALFYFMNYYVLLGGTMVLPFDALWSLAVEEHYYLIYPWIIRHKPEHLLIGMTLVRAALVLAWRYVLVSGFHVTDGRTYVATDTRIDSILFGAMLSVMMEAKFNLTILNNRFVIGLSALALFASFVVRDDTFRSTLRYSVQGVALIPLFYWGVFGWPKFALTNPVLMWVGRLSYSLYLWHLPLIWMMTRVFGLPEFTAIPLFVPAAGLSYYVIEMPLHGLRRKLHRKEMIVSDAPIASI